MAFKISITPLTFFEIDDALLYYERKLQGLGQRFLHEVSISIDNVKQQPENYLLIYPPVRRIRLHSFPYKVFYLIKDSNEIVIIALIHAKRSKQFVRKRLKKQ